MTLPTTALPQAAYETGAEDTSSIEDNIDTLYDKFIVPIEKLRSIAQAPPGILQASQIPTLSTNLVFDQTNPMESRASTFYRMLGLPVVANSGAFYNPGFNPDKTTPDSTRDGINSTINATDLQNMQLRETSVQATRAIFANQDVTASVFSMVMGLQPKKFNNFDNSAQSYSVPSRTLEVTLISNTNPNLATDIGASVVNVTGGLHILKPFTTNPAINLTVRPRENQICVPFLQDMNATRLSADPQVFLLRPGIEYILRARLADNIPDPNFLNDLKNILNQVKAPSPTFPENLDTKALISDIRALATQNSIPGADVDAIFGKFSGTQVYIVTYLIKTIKAVIDLLIFSVSELDKIRRTNKGINFLPIPGKDGPETIGTFRNDLVANTDIDVNITQLTIKKLNADREITISKGLGNFSTPFSNLEKVNTYEEQLQKYTNLRNELGNLGLKHLRTIEIIMGEVSGLGLIDILSIYTALWSISIDDLLGLIDKDSVTRLSTFNSDLVTSNVQTKINGAGSAVKSSLTSLETLVGNLLSFADKLFLNSLESPQEADKGNLT